MNRGARIATTLTWCIMLAGLAACGGKEGVQFPSEGSTNEGMASHTLNGVDANNYFATSGGVEGYFFVTPSGQWRCAIIPGGSSPQAGCQPASNGGAGIDVDGVATVVDPFSGQQVMPNAILVDLKGGPRFERLGQAIFWLDTGVATVLPYDRPLSVGGFTCNAQKTGVSCKIDDNSKGFTFSTDGYSMDYTEVDTVSQTAVAPGDFCDADRAIDDLNRQETWLAITTDSRLRPLDGQTVPLRKIADSDHAEQFGYSESELRKLLSETCTIAALSEPANRYLPALAAEEGQSQEKFDIDGRNWGMSDLSPQAFMLGNLRGLCGFDDITAIQGTQGFYGMSHVEATAVVALVRRDLCAGG